MGSDKLNASGHRCNRCGLALSRACVTGGEAVCIAVVFHGRSVQPGVDLNKALARSERIENEELTRKLSMNK